MEKESLIETMGKIGSYGHNPTLLMKKQLKDCNNCTCAKRNMDTP
jgi:hypothetical protein